MAESADRIGPPVTTDENVPGAVQAWSVAPYHLRHEILRQGIQRVEFRPRNSEISGTFPPDPWARFRPRQGCFFYEAVNRKIADE